MKKLKILTLVLVIMALMLPVASVYAVKVKHILTVRNRTGGDIMVDLYADTKHNANTFIPGLSQILVKGNLYKLYVSTPCGNTSGWVNINFRKTLFVGCKDGSPYVQLDKQFIGYRMTHFTP